MSVNPYSAKQKNQVASPESVYLFFFYLFVYLFIIVLVCVCGGGRCVCVGGGWTVYIYFILLFLFTCRFSIPVHDLQTCDVFNRQVEFL